MEYEIAGEPFDANEESDSRLFRDREDQRDDDDRALLIPEEVKV